MSRQWHTVVARASDKKTNTYSSTKQMVNTEIGELKMITTQIHNNHLCAGFQTILSKSIHVAWTLTCVDFMMNWRWLYDGFILICDEFILILWWFYIDFIMHSCWFYDESILTLWWIYIDYMLNLYCLYDECIFYDEFILILSWFNNEFMMDLSWFYHDFIMNSYLFYDGFILVLSLC